MYSTARSSSRHIDTWVSLRKSAQVVSLAGECLQRACWTDPHMHSRRFTGARQLRRWVSHSQLTKVLHSSACINCWLCVKLSLSARMVWKCTGSWVQMRKAGVFGMHATCSAETRSTRTTAGCKEQSNKLQQLLQRHPKPSFCPVS